MESTAIIVGLILVNVFSGDNEQDLSWVGVLKEACLNSSVFLLVGSLVIGAVTDEHGGEILGPLTEELFYGVLAFFLLDMGIIAARRIRDLQKTGAFLISFSISIRLLNAAIALAIAYAIEMSQGNALLFAVLSTSASHIVVPAAMGLTAPEVNPSLYISMALAVSFPFNIIVGIPVYLCSINLLWG